MPPLTRTAATTADAPPARVVHAGLGAFHRAHQAWYTHHANLAVPTDAWGIAAFTGRRPDAATPIAQQDGLFHALIRAAEGDRCELIEALVGAYDGADLTTWRQHVADPAVGCVTTTVTEAAYRRSAAGGLDVADPDVAADIALVQSSEQERAASTTPGRLVQGLAARWRADAGPIAIVPCDNLVDNGGAVRQVVVGFAEQISAELAAWIDQHVSFVSTTIDRITPATTDEDRARVAELTGWQDQAPVVTEPFVEWVLAGAFPNGRPAWDRAGARFVDDVHPFEQRKLWLLNGAHSLLAYAAPTRGHATVAEAVGDEVCRGWMDAWWDEACRHLNLPAEDLTAYRAALLDRFANPRIRHNLAQIAMDGSQKLPIRVLPTLRRERERGVVPEGGVHALAGWLAHLRDGGNVRDPRGEELTELATGPTDEATKRVLATLDPALVDDTELVSAVHATYRDLTGG